MDNKFLIIANWKSNWPKNWHINIPENIEVAVAPPFPVLTKINYPLCAQDASMFPEGSYTGEVAAKFLKELGVKYCLVGHSERRTYFHETNNEIERKVKELHDVGITPIVCARTFSDIVPAQFIMYEPEEAISTNGGYHPATDINEVLTDWQNKLPEGTRFLYGGSVNPENCSLLIANCSLIAGFVVGHASLDPQTFSDIITKCS